MLTHHVQELLILDIPQRLAYPILPKKAEVGEQLSQTNIRRLLTKACKNRKSLDFG
jgi:hypothetical protein